MTTANKRTPYDPLRMAKIINAAIIRGSMNSEELKALEQLHVFHGTLRLGNRLEEGERKYAQVCRLIKILELRRDGLTWEQIANELDYTIHKCKSLHNQAVDFATWIIENGVQSSDWLKHTRFPI